MTYNKMSYISGVIIFISAVIFFWSVAWLSGQRIISSSEYRMYFKFPDVVGLRDRSQVFMRGYRIGWTKGVQFEPDGVVVRVDIKKKFRVPMDSKIEINTLNLIGEKAITIEPGTSTEMLPPEGMLMGQNKDVMIMAKDMLTTVRKKIDTGELDDGIHNAATTLKTLADLVTKMDTKIDRVDVDMYNRQIAEIGDAARAMREAATDAGKEVTTLAKQGQTSVKQVEETAAHLSELSVQLNGIATKLNNGDGSMGELLHNKQYVQNLNSTVTELKLLVEDIKKNPGRYVSVSVF